MKKIYIAFGIAIALICGFAFSKIIDNAVNVEIQQTEESPKADTLEGAAELALARVIYRYGNVEDVSVEEKVNLNGDTYLHYECMVDGEHKAGVLDYNVIDNFLK